jgi:hypothetical protein
VQPAPTPLDPIATVNLRGTAAEVLPALIDAHWSGRPQLPAAASLQSSGACAIVTRRRRLRCRSEGTNNVQRPWGIVCARLGSAALLVAGVIGGVALAQDDSAGQGARSLLTVQAAADDVQLLRTRHEQAAATRARQREAERAAAKKVAAAAKAAAAKARKLEKKAIERKKALRPYDGPIPASCQEFSGNRKTGCALMLEAGFAIDQFPCLEKLWDHESGWNAKAENRSSGAYGIPQALPGRKMGSVADDWRVNPATQIKWGLGYIKNRYKTPCGAWSHFQRTNSY